MSYYNILKRPLLSEKSNKAREQQQKYTFIVDLQASKDDVKKAVERVFNVNVVNVNTTILRGKNKRRGMFFTLTKKKKKAFVTLSEGQKLSIFEDQ